MAVLATSAAIEEVRCHPYMTHDDDTNGWRQTFFQERVPQTGRLRRFLFLGGGPT